MGPISVTLTEDSIRTEVSTKRVRVSEFFKDFDRLRSGFITISQFKRCLDQNLRLTLHPYEVENLVAKYNTKNDDMVNYRLFSDVIDQNFQPCKLDADPKLQTREPLEYLGTTRSLQPPNADISEKVKDILEKVQSYYAYHGINVRTCYEDFDKHHNGLVTRSQFARSFPGPPDVTESEIDILSEHYKDPTRSSLCNYLNFHNDVEMIKAYAQEAKLNLSGFDAAAVSGSFADQMKNVSPDLRSTFEKIRVAVFKNGIRTTEFFRDHDKLRSGIITENQFVCGLSLACGKEAQLSKAEIQAVANHYKTPDDRVCYKEFCDIMESTFNVPGLEKHPTVHPVRPPRGALTRNVIGLSKEEEDRIEKILASIRETVLKRRLLIYPYFKDYDRGIAYTRNVTKSQFARILHFLSLAVGEEDTGLLCRKFEEPISGDVNYPAFCQAVDQEFRHYTVDAATQPPSSEYVATAQSPRISTAHVDLKTLLARIRHHALVNRIRVIEFFQDFDPLRSGSISKAIFQRGLNSMGITSIRADQLKALCDLYEDPKKSDCVLWTNFLVDIESVFTQPNLEKHPTLKVPPFETFHLPNEGCCTNWNGLSEEVRAQYDEALFRMFSRSQQRRLLAKPIFQDFDRHNNGHVTKSQFRQCLAYLDLNGDENEVAAIEKKFSDNIGFNYLKFLDELEPRAKQQPKYPAHLKELQAVNAFKKPPEIDALTTLDSIIRKIKIKVYKERMRIYEFMRDYDKLRTGRILIPNFKRSLDLAGLELKESEVKILEDAYRSYGQPDYVNYLAFQDEIESIFTLKNLEKTPLTEPNQFKPPIEWQQNELTSEEQIVFKQAMDRLAEHVRKTRTQLFPLFEDYDRVHNGSVSRFQFHRVLSELELGSLLSEQEFRVIFCKFKVRIGGKDDVNYIAFCDSVYELAAIEPFKP